ncbi:MAG: hypothetical protein PF517_05055 [Salinivirgaceae bacterium]|jgi:hypothetical protein|nr:hypothetical protein [Salinivirgaceae bacterium]
MNQSINIKVNQPANSGIGASLSSLLTVISSAKQANAGDTINIDLSTVSFVHPTLILPLTLLIKDLESKGCSLSFNYNVNSAGYFNTIAFPVGWNPKEKENWQALLAQFNNKTYIPILAIPCNAADENFRGVTLTLLGNIIKTQIGF